MRRKIIFLCALISASSAWAREWSAGPSLSVGLVQPYSISIDGQYEKFIEGGLSYGSYTYKLNGKTEGDIKLESIQASVRWFPWAGSFFVGSLLGRRVIAGDFSRELKYKKAEQKLEFTAMAEAKLTSYYITPHVGWRWLWDSGFLLGTDIGYHLTFSSSAESDVSASDYLIETAAKSTESYKEFKSDVDDTLKKAAALHLPYITLLRIGYFF